MGGREIGKVRPMQKKKHLRILGSGLNVRFLILRTGHLFSDSSYDLLMTMFTLV